MRLSARFFYQAAGFSRFVRALAEVHRHAAARAP